MWVISMHLWVITYAHVGYQVCTCGLSGIHLWVIKYELAGYQVQTSGWPSTHLWVIEYVPVCYCVCTCGLSSMCLTPFTSWLRNLALSGLLNSDLRTDAICTRQDNACKKEVTVYTWLLIRHLLSWDPMLNLPILLNLAILRLTSQDPLISSKNENHFSSQKIPNLISNSCILNTLQIAIISGS